MKCQGWVGGKEVYIKHLMTNIYNIFLEMLVSTYLGSWSVERIKSKCWGPTPPLHGRSPLHRELLMGACEGLWSRNSERWFQLVLGSFLTVVFQMCISLSPECSLSLYPRLPWGVGVMQPVWVAEWNSHSGHFRCLCHLSSGAHIGTQYPFSGLPLPHFCSGLALRSMCHIIPIFSNISRPKSV